MKWLLFSFITQFAYAQEEIDLSAESTEKTYPYYDPLTRHPAYLILPLFVIVLAAVHLLKNNKRKNLSQRKPDIFFYPKTEKLNEKS